MNPNLKSRIDSILASCREIIALSEKLEKWTLSERAHCIAFGLNDDETGMAFDSEDVARFVVISRNLTPQIAKALIEAIKHHEKVIDALRQVGDQSPTVKYIIQSIIEMVEDYNAVSLRRIADTFGDSTSVETVVPSDRRDLGKDIDGQSDGEI